MSKFEASRHSGKERKCSTCHEPMSLHISTKTAEKREDNDDHLSTREREVYMKHRGVHYTKDNLHETFTNHLWGE